MGIRKGTKLSAAHKLAISEESRRSLELSAKGCGVDTYEEVEDGLTAHIENSNPFVWNPAENAEQDRMCMKAILARGYSLAYKESGGHGILLLIKGDYGEGDFFECPMEEFAARALAHIVESEDD